jgi:hypothetical protein
VGRVGRARLKRMFRNIRTRNKRFVQAVEYPLVRDHAHEGITIRRLRIGSWPNQGYKPVKNPLGRAQSGPARSKPPPGCPRRHARLGVDIAKRFRR